MIKDKRVVRKFVCYWCGFKFSQNVRKSFAENTSGYGRAKVSKDSDQVKCPSCSNFVRTWDSKPKVKKKFGGR